MEHQQSSDSGREKMEMLMNAMARGASVEQILNFYSGSTFEMSSALNAQQSMDLPVVPANDGLDDLGGLLEQLSKYSSAYDFDSLTASSDNYMPSCSAIISSSSLSLSSAAKFDHSVPDVIQKNDGGRFKRLRRSTDTKSPVSVVSNPFPEEKNSVLNQKNTLVSNQNPIPDHQQSEPSGNVMVDPDFDKFEREREEKFRQLEAKFKGTAKTMLPLRNSSRSSRELDDKDSELSASNHPTVKNELAKKETEPKADLDSSGALSENLQRKMNEILSGSGCLDSVANPAQAVALELMKLIQKDGLSLQTIAKQIESNVFNNATPTTCESNSYLPTPYGELTAVISPLYTGFGNYIPGPYPGVPAPYFEGMPLHVLSTQLYGYAPQVAPGTSSTEPPVPGLPGATPVGYGTTAVVPPPTSSHKSRFFDNQDPSYDKKVDRFLAKLDSKAKSPIPSSSKEKGSSKEKMRSSSLTRSKKTKHESSASTSKTRATDYKKKHKRKRSQSTDSSSDSDTSTSSDSSSDGKRKCKHKEKRTTAKHKDFKRSNRKVNKKEKVRETSHGASEDKSTVNAVLTKDKESTQLKTLDTGKDTDLTSINVGKENTSASIEKERKLLDKRELLLKEKEIKHSLLLRQQDAVAAGKERLLKEIAQKESEAATLRTQISVMEVRRKHLLDRENMLKENLTLLCKQYKPGGSLDASTSKMNTENERLQRELEEQIKFCVDSATQINSFVEKAERKLQSYDKELKMLQTQMASGGDDLRSLISARAAAVEAKAERKIVTATAGNSNLSLAGNSNLSSAAGIQINWSRPSISAASTLQEETQASLMVALRIQQLREDEESKFEYFDAGCHWCRQCNITCETVTQFFEHLHSPQHQAVGITSRPWAEDSTKSAKKSNANSAEKAFASPLKGSEFVVPVKGFFCNLCKKLFGDSLGVEEHAKSHAHNTSYQTYVKANPNYERRFNMAKTASIALGSQKMVSPKETKQSVTSTKSEQKPAYVIRPDDNFKLLSPTNSSRQDVAADSQSTTTCFKPQTVSYDLKKGTAAFEVCRASQQQPKTPDEKPSNAAELVRKIREKMKSSPSHNLLLCAKQLQAVKCSAEHEMSHRDTWYTSTTSNITGHKATDDATATTTSDVRVVRNTHSGFPSSKFSLGRTFSFANRTWKSSAYSNYASSRQEANAAAHSTSSQRVVTDGKEMSGSSRHSSSRYHHSNKSCDRSTDKHGDSTKGIGSANHSPSRISPKKHSYSGSSSSRRFVVNKYTHRSSYASSSNSKNNDHHSSNSRKRSRSRSRSKHRSSLASSFSHHRRAVFGKTVVSSSDSVIVNGEGSQPSKLPKSNESEKTENAEKQGSMSISVATTVSADAVPASSKMPPPSCSSTFQNVGLLPKIRKTAADMFDDDTRPTNGNITEPKPTQDEDDEIVIIAEKVVAGPMKNSALTVKCDLEMMPALQNPTVIVATVVKSDEEASHFSPYRFAAQETDIHCRGNLTQTVTSIEKSSMPTDTSACNDADGTLPDVALNERIGTPSQSSSENGNLTVVSRNSAQLGEINIDKTTTNVDQEFFGTRFAVTSASCKRNLFYGGNR